MTGPGHYREAERLLEQAHVDQAANGPGCGTEELIAEAQVHATLAVCAAQVLSMATSGLYPEPACGEWEEAVSA